MSLVLKQRSRQGHFSHKQYSKISAGDLRSRDGVRRRRPSYQYPVSFSPIDPFMSSVICSLCQVANQASSMYGTRVSIPKTCIVSIKVTHRPLGYDFLISLSGQVALLPTEPRCICGCRFVSHPISCGAPDRLLLKTGLQVALVRLVLTPDFVQVKAHNHTQ